MGSSAALWYFILTRSSALTALHPPHAPNAPLLFSSNRIKTRSMPPPGRIHPADGGLGVCARAILAWLSPLELLRGPAKASRELHALVQRLHPVHRVPAEKLPALPWQDGIRVQVEGGRLALLDVRHACQISGRGTIQHLRVQGHKTSAVVRGLALARATVLLRGALHLVCCDLHASPARATPPRVPIRAGTQDHPPTLLKARDATSVRCTHCHFHGGGTETLGLWAQDCGNLELAHCDFSHHGTAILLERCARARLRDLVVTQSQQVGLLLERCSGAALANCAFRLNAVGLLVSACETLRAHALCTDGHGVALKVYDSRSCAVGHSEFGAGVSVRAGSHLVLHHSTLEQGIHVQDASPTIVDNLIRGSVVLEQMHGVLAHNHIERPFSADDRTTAYANHVA